MQGNGLERLQVLVVDDSETIRRLLRTVLTSFGIGKVVVANDGTAALSALEQRNIDIVIADLAMQPMDGIAFLRKLRADTDAKLSMLPVILMTAHSERHLIEQARDAGVSEAVAKPISARALWARIEAVIERPRPFVRCATYIGPDRRRREDPAYAGPERRKDTWTV